MEKRYSSSDSRGAQLRLPAPAIATTIYVILLVASVLALLAHNPSTAKASGLATAIGAFLLACGELSGVIPIAASWVLASPGRRTKARDVASVMFAVVAVLLGLGLFALAV